MDSDHAETEREEDRQAVCSGFGRQYSSPPCMLHELNPDFLELPETRRLPPRPAIHPHQNWEDVRLWRQGKRAVLIEQRAALKAAERTAKGEAITALLTRILPISPGPLISFYWPFKAEYDPRPLARTLHRRGFRLSLPVVLTKAKPLIFREWWPGVRMRPGVWNIPVPVDIESVNPDILLVPLVGFDCQGYRLGYGGGYYDRTLAALPVKPKAIGIGFDFLEIKTIYPQPHDIAMDVIVTENGVARK